MSKAIHELLNNDQVAASHGLSGIQGGFPMDEAVLEGNNTGGEVNLNDDSSLSNAERHKVTAAEAYGYSAWTITARIS